MTVSTQAGTFSAKEQYSGGVVPKHLVLSIWDRVEGIIKENPSKGSPLFSTPPQILDALLQGRMSLWIGGRDSEVEIVLICSVVQYPAARTTEINYVGGRGIREAMKYVFPLIERWALDQGCTHIELITVPGIMRLLRKWSYRPLAEYACKPLVTFNS